MWFERIVAEGLSHISYIVGSGGKAAVIDPRRDCDIYLDFADRHDSVITHIFETHRNEDYVIGSIELAHRCGAQICHGTKMDFAYGNPVRENDMFPIGTLALTALETPGHTEESLSYVLSDTEVSPDPYMVFSGDTLFPGDIARTDFFGNDRKAEMAEKIYESITGKLFPLGDCVIVCPAHGAGSLCGGEIVDHPFTTLGYEKRTNPLILMGKEAFVRHRATESPYFPPYFKKMEDLNRKGALLLSTLARPQPLSVPDVKNLVSSGCQVVDLRSPSAFAAGYIPQSISIWRDGISQFAGWVLSYDLPIVIIADYNCDLQTLFAYFTRTGYDNISGWLASGFPAWFRAAQPLWTIKTCAVQDLKGTILPEKPFLLDVREIKNRIHTGWIAGSHHVYVGEVLDHLDEIPRDRPVVIYCNSGYKGTLAASLLARAGYRDITNVLGGMQAWINAGYPVEK
ncbi:MAG: MBL fold metallo-hydrolase [Methanoregula sp.]|nr:MBL fold metallo-hydrolase [Methanoregula sp.]